MPRATREQPMSEHTIAWLPSPPVAPPHAPTMAGEADPLSASEARPEITRLLPGAVVPGTRYRLRRWLGDGGMGVVYEAEQIDLERPVALKILRAHIAQSEHERDKFRQEARTTMRIASPNVVQILDFGVLPDGRVFYAMELLAGQPLSAEIARGPIAAARVIGLLRQMCAGLAAAHHTGVIHRDVKPDNTMVVKDRSGRACIKLLDFGIAIPGSDATSRRAAGTPEYMAPEQIEGKPFDARLDVYALGCTAYEMLTGLPPFCKGSTLAIIQAHIEDLPAPLSQGNPRLEIPAELGQLVMRCIAKAPDDRFASMAELEAGLCEAQIAAGLRTEWDDLPLPDIGAVRRDRLAARMPQARATRRARHRRLVVLATASLATLVTGLWLSSATVGAADHDRIEQLVATTRAAADRGAYVYPQRGEHEETAYATLVTLEGIEGPAAGLADQAAAQVRRTLADDLLALGDQYWEDPLARPYARDYYAQAILFDPASDHARARAGFTPGELTDLRVRAEAVDFTEPELVAAQPLAVLAVVDDAERARKLAELAAVDVRQSASSGRRLHALARQGAHQDTDDKATPSVIKRRLEPPRPNLAVAARNDVEPSRPSRREKASARTFERKAKRASSAGSRDAAVRLFQRTLELDPSNATAMRGLSDLFFDRGEYDRALHHARRATQLEPSNGAGFLQLGDAYFKVLDQPAARRAYERAVGLGRSDARDRLRNLHAAAKR